MRDSNLYGTDEVVVELLANSRNIAVVGLGTDPEKPVYRVAEFLQRKGKRIIPIHPREVDVLGEKTYSSLTAAVNAGEQIDMVDSGMSITAERAKVVQFSNPYWTVSRVFVVPADSKLTPADILSKKIQLGVQRGTSEANDIKKEQEEKKYPFELRFYESSPLAVEDLLNGRIQAALMDELPANNAIENGRAVKKAGTHGEPDQFGVAMRKEDKELQKLVNEGYKKLIADPYWKELQKKYLSK